MTALHDWHRTEFTKREDKEIEFPARTTTFGGTFPAVRKAVNLGRARAAVCQRVVNAMTPDEWAHAQKAFDASAEGKDLAKLVLERLKASGLEGSDADLAKSAADLAKDPSVRREWCELWLLRKLYEAEHPELVAESEYALVMILDAHATPAKIAAHKARLVAHVKHGKPLGVEEPKPAPAPAAPPKGGAP